MYENVCYTKPFLKEVVARIDFLAPVEGFDRSLPQKLANDVTKWFPIAEPSEGFIAQVQIAAQGGVQEQRRAFKQWNFFGKDREKQLTVAPGFIYVLFTRYSKFEELRDIWSGVTEGVTKPYPDVQAARFGLRYINSIDIEGLAPTQWNDYINDDLLDSSGFLHQANNLTRLLHLAEFKYDDLDLRFTFGLPNPDYPAIMKRPTFVLDFDVYVQTAHGVAESLKYMDKGHEIIQDLFEKSIKDRLRERMNAAPTATL